MWLIDKQAYKGTNTLAFYIEATLHFDNAFRVPKCSKLLTSDHCTSSGRNCSHFNESAKRQLQS